MVGWFVEVGEADLVVPDRQQAKEIDRFVGEDADQRRARPGTQVDYPLHTLIVEPERGHGPVPSGPGELAHPFPKTRVVIAEPVLQQVRVTGAELDVGAAVDHVIAVVPAFTEDTGVRLPVVPVHQAAPLDPLIQRDELIGNPHTGRQDIGEFAEQSGHRPPHGRTRSILKVPPRHPAISPQTGDHHRGRYHRGARDTAARFPPTGMTGIFSTCSKNCAPSSTRPP